MGVTVAAIGEPELSSPNLRLLRKTRTHVAYHINGSGEANSRQDNRQVAVCCRIPGADRGTATETKCAPLFHDAHDDEHELQNQDDDDRQLEELTA
jgi:hypothetical protein